MLRCVPLQSSFAPRRIAQLSYASKGTTVAINRYHVITMCAKSTFTFEKVYKNANCEV